MPLIEMNEGTPLNSVDIDPGRRVLVLWADGASPNLGVRVLGAGAQALARSVWGPRTHVNLQDFAGTQTGVPMGIKAIFKESFARRSKIREFIKTHDVVLDTGAGDSFTDIYGYKRMLTIFIIQRWCLRLKVPVIMLPQTIGPFKSRVGRMLATRQLKRISYVMARDPKSAAMSEELGRVPELTSSDLVFALAPEASTREFDILLNVSGLLWNQNRHIDFEQYRAAIFEFLQEMERRGRRVTLFAHVVNGARNDDDLTAIDDVARASNPNVDVAVPCSLREARQMIAGANLVVGARMHACLNALSLGIPTIPWAYSRKFAPLLAQLGWEYFVDLRTEQGVAKASTEILDSVNSRELKARAVDVAAVGAAALSSTADGLRSYTA